MAEGERPVIQPGAASAKRQVSARQLLIWVAGAAVLAAAAFAVVRFVGFGGTESQSASSPATLPPDPVPTTTVTTTTTEATVPTSDSVPPADETSDAESTPPESDAESTPPESDAASPTTTAPPVEAPDPPPAPGHFVRISEGGDFTGAVTLRCADYVATVDWNVLPPFEPGEGGGRNRTAAPFGDQGYLRVIVETFVPPEVHPDAPEEGDPDTGDSEASEDGPTEPPAEEPVPQVPESVMVLDASSISGRGTDRAGEGEAVAVLRHRCPAESFDEHAEWKLMVEAHAEVAWELTFGTGDAEAGDDGVAEPSDAIGGVNGNEDIDEIIEGILGGEGVGGP
ncbi:hypothetical protein [Candidatus Poriferisodalis sp.]|uniref:hypothetical protein n=1 Tax=Candidatus Poriferisodalis sp. TaxID=3101277 RepID=UPI003B0254EF